MLSGKRIVLGITGSIAAYKAAVLTRLLVKAGAEVRIVMTRAAHDFITPLTMATLSRNPVLTDFVNDQSGQWNNHVELGLWADILLIAPASAGTLAKMAHGICDNLLLAVYLSARCPVVVAPAMDVDMLHHPSTADNLSRLKNFGNHVIEPVYGELASGLIGSGRMAEPEAIIDWLNAFFASRLPLTGKKALVTAAPTFEAIDPVRFIGNHSSGKMGFAIAEALADAGAEVVLISGPTALHTSRPRIRLIRVTTAEEMYQASVAAFPEMDISVLAAAVADYKPADKAEHKIKKKEEKIVLELVKTHDIAQTLGQQKKDNQLLVGFALETENERVNARQKLQDKNFDLIVLNSMNDKGATFGYDTNKITIIDRALQEQAFELKDKREVARDIVQAIINRMHA